MAASLALGGIEMKRSTLVFRLLALAALLSSGEALARGDVRKVLTFGDSWGVKTAAPLEAVLNANPLTGETYEVVNLAKGGTPLRALGSEPGEGITYWGKDSGHTFLRDSIGLHPDVDIIHLSVGGWDRISNRPLEDIKQDIADIASLVE
jgi:hypothetical protein